MTELTCKETGITTIAQMKGKKVGVWCCGNEYELYAALDKNGIDPEHEQGRHDRQPAVRHEPVPQTQIDAASAMTYNELAQVLETKNPETGKLYTLKRPQRDQDAEGRHRHARGRHLHDRHALEPGEPAIAVKFIAASLKGWIYCRDHVADA